MIYTFLPIKNTVQPLNWICISRSSWRGSLASGAAGCAGCAGFGCAVAYQGTFRSRFHEVRVGM